MHYNKKTFNESIMGLNRFLIRAFWVKVDFIEKLVVVISQQRLKQSQQFPILLVSDKTSVNHIYIFIFI